MTLPLLHSEFPFLWGKFSFLFYEWTLRYTYCTAHYCRKLDADNSSCTFVEVAEPSRCCGYENSWTADLRETSMPSFCCSEVCCIILEVLDPSYTVKKGQWFSGPQPGCHLSNSPWPGIIKLFPPREILVSDIPAGDGKTANLFLQCKTQSASIFSDSRSATDLRFEADAF